MKSVVLLVCLYLFQAQAFPDLLSKEQDYWVAQGEKATHQEDDKLTEDLEFLLNMPEHDESYKRSKKLRPGQIRLACSDYKFGCCPDNKTPAKKQDKSDCGPKLCIDTKVALCAKRKEQGRLNCEDEEDSNRCAHTCGNCKNPATPLDECRKNSPRFGCCWNGVAALGPNGRGCSRCHDINPFTCKQFAHLSGGCNSASYGIRTFMVSRCAKTCGICKYSYEKK